MHHSARMVAAVVGGTAGVSLGALRAGLAEVGTAPASGAGPPQMPLGATSTETTPFNAPAVGEAAPAIMGPAPLPSEEKGPPG